MKTSNKNKKYILIFGIPRSGTTIICSYINSLDNAFCISEPILGGEICPEKVLWDKIEPCVNTDPHSIINHCKSYCHIDKFCVGGIKEIWTPFHRSSSIKALQSEKFDNKVFVVRNPVDIFASWKATTWAIQPCDNKHGFIDYNNVEYLLFTYNKFLKLIIEHSNNCNIILYENFIIDAKKSLKLCDVHIQGQEILRNNVYNLGDGDARKSKKVTKTPSKRRLLDVREIKQIESSEIFKEYQRIKEDNSKILQHS